MDISLVITGLVIFLIVVVVVVTSLMRPERRPKKMGFMSLLQELEDIQFSKKYEDIKRHGELKKELDRRLEENDE